MFLEKISCLFFGLLGCATIPISMHDKRLLEYKPKILDQDFKYDPTKTQIAKKYKKELTTGRARSGATLIDDGLSAFVIRAAFARMATKTIDLQTYIYSNDFSSHILIDELKNAADRGVKVRVLIDDYGTNSDIADVILLNQHPNIEVKIFNAVKKRSRFLYYPQMLMDFNRLNSRMHNKLFIVDNVALITGGRNVGSNYFMPETAVNFSDTDVLFMGAIAGDATKSFNAYWNHHLAVPAFVIPKACSRHALKKLEKQFKKLARTNIINKRKYDAIISMTIREFNRKNFDFSWGSGKFIADPPEKVDLPPERKAKYVSEIILALNRLWKKTQKSAYVSAAYFVPGQGGLKKMCDEEKSGVHLTIVTNSLASTNAPTVYGKWEEYRTKLIQSGVDVYEFMLSAENRRGKKHDRTRKKTRFSVMHSKTMVFDDKISWIGSFNLDPRSAYYNTENVVIFESAEFAKKLRDMIIDDTKISWHVAVKNGVTTWRGLRPGDTKQRIYHHGPDTTIFRRAFKILTKIIPEKFV
ncbi:MAG: phospholipase D family protein [Alphaproteobacteria bacterium]|nr:phospholipase D family protein [Alphaproteobacteria bacterium]